MPVIVIIVTLDVFSGRPNPEWRLTPSQAEAAVERLSALPTSTEPPLEPPGLGYRGLVVTAYEGTKTTSWRIYGGMVSDGNGATRLDAGRKLELWLLATGKDAVEEAILTEVRRQISGEP